MTQAFNRRGILPTLPGDLIQRAENGDFKAIAQLFKSTSDKITQLNKLHEANAGMHGTVSIAQQQTAQGPPPPSIILEGAGRAQGGPAIQDAEFVTLAQLKKATTCPALYATLQQCTDIADIGEAAASGGSPACGGSQFSLLAALVPSANDLATGGTNLVTNDVICIGPYFVIITNNFNSGGTVTPPPPPPSLVPPIVSLQTAIAGLPFLDAADYLSFIGNPSFGVIGGTAIYGSTLLGPPYNTGPGAASYVFVSHQNNTSSIPTYVSPAASVTYSDVVAGEGVPGDAGNVIIIIDGFPVFSNAPQLDPATMASSTGWDLYRISHPVWPAGMIMSFSGNYGPTGSGTLTSPIGSTAVIGNNTLPFVLDFFPTPINTNSPPSGASSQAVISTSGEGIHPESVVDLGGTVAVWVLEIETLTTAAYLVPLTVPGNPGTGGRACTSSGYIYFCDNSSATVWIISVRDAQNPQFIGAFSTPSGVAPIKDLFACGAQLYVALGSGHLALYDISNPSDPVLVSQFGQGNYTGVWGNDIYCFATDPLRGVVDVFDLTNVLSPGLVNFPLGASGAANNQFLVVEGTIVYVTNQEGEITVFEFTQNPFGASSSPPTYTLLQFAQAGVPGMGFITGTDGLIFGAQGSTLAIAQYFGGVATGNNQSFTITPTATGQFSGPDQIGNTIPGGLWATGKPVVRGKYCVIAGQLAGGGFVSPGYAVGVFDVGGFICPNITTGSLVARQINSPRMSTEVLDASNVISSPTIISFNGFVGFQADFDPSTADIGENRWMVWANTNTGIVKLYYNYQGALKSVTLS